MECAICGNEVCTHPIYLTNGRDWECRVCGEVGGGVNPPHYFVPMYEGEVVNPNTHEWAGFDACKECSDKSVLMVE